MLTRQRLLAALTSVSFLACTTTEPPASQGLHDEFEKECAALKRKIRLAERDETTQRNYSTAFQIRANSALERLEKHKPMLKMAEAATEVWEKKVKESGSDTAWTHASTAILFVVEGLSLIKLGSAIRTTGRACTTLGVKGATKAAYQFTKREITDAFGKGTLSGTKKVFGLAVRAGAPPALLTGINAERYFRHDDWTMAIPIYGTWQEHELKIDQVNSYGDALAAVKASRDEVKELVASLEKDVAEQEVKVKEHLKAAEEAKKLKEALKKQLADLLAKQPAGCMPTDEDSPDPLPDDPTDTPTPTPPPQPGDDIRTPGIALLGGLGTPTPSSSGVATAKLTVEPFCAECACGIWDDGAVDLPDGADFTWLGEEEYGIEPDRMVEPLKEVLIINYTGSQGGQP
jgi:hypothetical protein